MMDIDWSKAPEGAEFWNPNSKLFYRSADGEFQKFSETRGRWTLASGEKYEYQILIAKPVEWNGEGLPPVGMVCELKKAMKFTEGTRLDEFPAGTELIVGGHANFYGNPVLAVCVKNRNFTGTLTPECVRPIRTPEQIAAEKREAEILEIFHATGLRKRDGGREVAEAIYRAGYRKQVAP